MTSLRSVSVDIQRALVTIRAASQHPSGQSVLGQQMRMRGERGGGVNLGKFMRTSFMDKSLRRRFNP